MLETATLFLILNVALKAIIAFSLLILAHEFGHFLVAKASGVWVEEFGFGLPPRLWGKKVGETVYSLNLLPIGGFVRLHGETGDGSLALPERAFVNKSKKSRATIALAGILANFALAILAFGIFYSFAGILKDRGVKVVEVMPDSPAAEAGFQKDDEVLKVDGKEVVSVSAFQEIVAEKRGESLAISIKRQDAPLVVTPRIDAPPDQGPLGVVITPVETYTYYPPLWQRPFVGIYHGFGDALFLSQAIIKGIFGMAGQVSQGQVPEGVVGPFGILALFIYVSKLGILPLLNFTGVFSVNLAILNLIPFPPLDGSRVLFVGLEGLLGRKILPKVESGVHIAGMILLLLLMLALTTREIPKLLKAGSINSFVESILPVE
jgi:regulator of sigma E protease